jgi:hypothetical protein
MQDKWRRQKKVSKDVETVQPSGTEPRRLAKEKYSPGDLRLRGDGAKGKAKDQLFTPTQAELSRRKEVQGSGQGACCTIS